MDQIVRTAQAHPPIEAALGLDRKGRSSRRRRWWLILLAAAVLSAAGLYGYSRFGGDQVKIVYTTEPAATTDLVITVSATGTLAPLTQVDVSSELSGIMRSVMVDENSEVKKGDVVAELDTARLQAQVEGAQASAKAAEAAIATAQATLQQDEQVLSRTERLQQRGMATQEALETAQAERARAASAVTSAEANLAVAAAALKMQQTDLSKSQIYAPIDGIVLTRSVDPGQTVASSMQAPVLFVIAEDLKHMVLKAAIDEADIGQVAKGQHATFTVDAFPGETFDAEISDIAYASVTTDGVVTYEAKLSVDNAKLLLRPGMTATVSVVTREAKNVLAVPNTAFRYRPPAADGKRGFSLQDLFMPRRPGRGGPRGDAAAGAPAAREKDAGRVIYVLRDGAPVRARVKVGSTDGERSEILSGVEAGDAVITGSSINGVSGG